MTAEPSTEPIAEQPLGESQTAKWMAVIAAVTIVLAVAWGRAPEQIKQPGLSAILLAAFAGWGVGRLAREFRVGSAKLVGGLAGSAVVAGLVGSAIVAHRAGVAIMEATSKARPPQVDPIKKHFEQALAQPDSDLSPEERQNLDQARANHELGEKLRRERELYDRQYLTFSGYLNHRIPGKWGVWLPPWPTVFWVAELLLAGGLAGWLAVRQSLQAIGNCC